ncbi:MAG: hypothetical protein IKX14_04010 [Neisseriaceae bacterium]|nr:hypothetical protein [Neisseriaceae bacterium]
MGDISVFTVCVAQAVKHNAKSSEIFFIIFSGSLKMSILYGIDDRKIKIFRQPENE